jgi:hypothetical protein
MLVFLCLGEFWRFFKMADQSEYTIGQRVVMGTCFPLHVAVTQFVHPRSCLIFRHIVASGIPSPQDRLRRDCFGERNRDASASWHTSPRVDGRPHRDLSFKLTPENSFISHLIVISFVRGRVLNLSIKLGWSSRVIFLVIPSSWYHVLMTTRCSMVYSDWSVILKKILKNSSKHAKQVLIISTFDTSILLGTAILMHSVQYWGTNCSSRM